MAGAGAKRGWLKGLTEKGAPCVWRSQAHPRAIFPLGGIATGSIGLGADGHFSQWQIWNTVDKKAHVPCSFFAIRCETPSGSSAAKVLEATAAHGLPHVRSTAMRGEYPIATIDYADGDLPVGVRMDAFSPYIPHETKDSALPGIIFRFTLTNRTDGKVRISLLGSLQNAVGHDGHSTVSGTRFVAHDIYTYVPDERPPGYGSNLNRLVRRASCTYIAMESAKYGRRDPHFGTMALATASKAGLSAIPQWEDVCVLWEDFASDGTLSGKGCAGRSKEGQTYNGALCVSATLAPGQTRRFTFMWAWHFPSRYVNWDDIREERYIGNYYSRWFADAGEVVRYMAENLERLIAGTFRFRDTFYDSTLPYYVLDCVSSQACIPRTPTCLWLRDGTFCGFEGCAEGRGCCPMNCTHVWNYEQTLAYTFPELERNMRRTDLGPQQEKDGMVHHRTAIPMWKKRESGLAMDGQLGTVLKSYRESRLTTSGRFLQKHWPSIRKALDYVIDHHDPEGSGVLRGEQFNTYDIAVYGPNSFVGSLYLAALRAGEEMARDVGDDAAAERYAAIFSRGSKALDEETFNGRWYIQVYDAQKYKQYQYGTGCLSDQVVGQWWAHQLDLGYVLPREHVVSALRSILEHNFLWDFSDWRHDQRIFANGSDKGLLNCTWPEGGRPEKPILYCDEVWTGVEYQVASHMIYEGMVQEGLQIVRAARERYDGLKRNPWNEIECGDQYVRAMSSWAILLALSGYVADGPEGLIGFAPRLSPERFRCFFAGPDCWGTFDQRRTKTRQTDTLIVKHGTLRVRGLRFELPEGASARSVGVAIDGDRAGAQLEQDGSRVLVTLSSLKKVREGSTLVVAISF